MRPVVAAVAVAGVLALCGLVAVGGRSIVDRNVGVTVDEIGPLPEGMFDDTEEAVPENDASAGAASDGSGELAGQASPPTASPTVNNEEALQESGLERLAPRDPLSELSQALPPGRAKAPPPDQWKPTRLFNPVAASAGVLEAHGYRVALAGIEPTPVDEMCTFEGAAWACGAQARTAFRAWLRARAVRCVVPPSPDLQLITAECDVGRDDVSSWLASSGWARATAGGPYAEMAATAKADRKGLFGPPPERITVTIGPTLPLSSINPGPDQPILDERGDVTAAPATVVDGPFPPPPPAPESPQ
ncbi:thermonuclease family protein [Arvimicrobium flavum]|uniref:thermonuclease family protein n=1 Tax=Arvimicrobium flavum TaxID=3393320 RepID=UPI00237B9FB8|nr:thermonuclease family protein [Mesorhizobium shangrilense]